MPDYRVEVYLDADKNWRWVCIAGNGERVSASTEGYVRKDHAVEQAKALNPGMEVEVEEAEGA